MNELTWNNLTKKSVGVVCVERTCLTSQWCGCGTNGTSLLALVSDLLLESLAITPLYQSSTVRFRKSENTKQMALLKAVRYRMFEWCLVLIVDTVFVILKLSVSKVTSRWRETMFERHVR